MLNKTAQTKSILKKARGVKLLCLSSVAVLSFSLMGVGQVKAQDDIYVSGSANPTAQMEVRLQQMETEIRELTGKTEQQAYEVRQLKKEIESLRPSGAEGNTLSQPTVKSKSAQEKLAEEAALLDAPKKVNKQPLNPLNFKLAPPSPSGMKRAIPGGTLDATAIYEQAYAHIDSKQYDEARVGFLKFLEGHPDHVLAANAKYWLGETFYVQGDYKKSAKAFAEGFQKFPKSAKSPDMLLKLGMSLAKLGKEKDACVALGQLAVKFPTEINPAKKLAEQEMKNLECK